MKQQRIYELMDGIREDFILEAEPKSWAALQAPARTADTVRRPRNIYATAMTPPVSRPKSRPTKGWMTAACLALAILLLGGGGVGVLLTVGGPGQSGEEGITSLFGPNFLPGLFPFLRPDETETPNEVTVRDPEEITEPADTRTECQKGNHEWELTDSGDAVCYRAGTVTYGCALCEESKAGEEQLLPHAYEDGYCTVCGLVEGAWENTAFSRAYDEDGKLYAIINKVQGSPEGLLILPNVYYDEIMEQLIPVTEIGRSALMGLDKITEVVIPNTVTHIYEYAFKGCGAMERVSFPEGLIAIKDEAFNQCQALSEAHLPDSVTELGYGVFMNCTSLVSATLPASFDTVPGGIYGNCKSLTDVTLKGTIKTVGGAAFMGCISLKQLPDMPELEVIGSNAFENCNGLTEVILPATLRELGHEAFMSCGSLKKVTIEAPSLYGIYTRVFTSCLSLEEITLPKIVGVFSGEEMFLQCGALTIYYPGTREDWQKNYENRHLKLPVDTKVICMEEETAE